jgi:hypothetical protein
VAVFLAAPPRRTQSFSNISKSGRRIPVCQSHCQTSSSQHDEGTLDTSHASANVCASYFSSSIGHHWRSPSARLHCVYIHPAKHRAFPVVQIGTSLIHSPPLPSALQQPPTASAPSLTLYCISLCAFAFNLHSCCTSAHCFTRHTTPFPTLAPPLQINSKSASWPTTRRRQFRPWGIGLSNRPSVCSSKAGWVGWTMTVGRGKTLQVTRASKARSFHHRPHIPW